MPLEKIESKTLRRRVYEQLKQNIIRGELVPGQSIYLREIADRFEVSVMPVREALRQLESEKIIVIKRNRSFCVNKLTSDEIREVLRIRLMLETDVAARSCDRRPESAVPELAQLLKNMEDSINVPREYIAHNSSFHFMVYKYADSPMLLHIIGEIWARIGPYLYLHATKGDGLFETMSYHREMYKAFASKDTTRLITVLKKDLETAASILVSILK